tara:strand:- start:2008 stop:3522 length:1515 start_codon:yes stop_codon:yes gene_type:complete
LNAFSVSKELSNLDKHLEYLSERGVIDSTHVSFIKNNNLTKKDSIFYFYKVLKVVDRDKATKEDLEVLESIVADISEYINEFKLELESNDSKFKSYSRQFEDTLDKVEEYEKTLHDLEEELSKLREVVEKSIDYDKNNLRKFLKKVDVSLGLKGAFGKSKLSSKYVYEIDLNMKIDGDFKVRAYNSNFQSFTSLYTFTSTTELGNLNFHSPKYKKAFVSPTKEIFLEIFDKFGLGFYNDSFQSYVLFPSEGSDEDINFIFNLDTSILGLSLLVDPFRVDNSILSYVPFAELSLNIPVSSSFFFGPGLEKGNDKYMALLFLGFEGYGIDLNLKYKHELLGEKDMVLVPRFAYRFNDKNKIGALIDWSLLEKEDFINRFKIVLDSFISSHFEMRLIFGMKKENGYSVNFLAGRVNYSSEDINFFLGAFLKDLNERKLALAVNVDFPTEFYKIFVRYIYSNFLECYKDLNFDFEGNHVSTTSQVGCLECTGSNRNFGELFIGLEIDI